MDMNNPANPVDRKRFNDPDWKKFLRHRPAIVKEVTGNACRTVSIDPTSSMYSQRCLSSKLLPMAVTHKATKPAG